MTTVNFKLSTFVAFMCLAFLLDSPGEAQPRTCNGPCRLLTGTCNSDVQCSQQCLHTLGSDVGYCLNPACWCKPRCCPKPSETWKGLCFDSNICDKQCKEQENALGGTCGIWVFHCECLYEC